MAGFDGYGMPAVDFSTLAKLGDIYDKGKVTGARDRVFAQASTDNSPKSLADLGTQLLRAGDLQGATSLAGLAHTMSSDDLDRTYKMGMLGLEREKLNKPQWGVISEGVFGDKTHGFIDPNKLTTTIPSNAGEQTNSSALVMGPSGEPLRGQELQAHLDKTQPAVGAAVRSILAGNENAAGRNLQKLLPIASLVEPGFTQQDYSTRLGVMKSFKQGPDAAGLKASNQAIAHADYANSLIDKLGNSSILPGYINPLVQGYKNNTGDKAFQETKTEYMNAVNALAGELTKVFRGSTGALADVQHWRETANVADSPAAMHANIKSAMKLLNGGLEAYAEKYNNGMRSNKQSIEFLSPKNQAAFGRLMGVPAAAPVQQATEGITSAVPQGQGPNEGADIMPGVRRDALEAEMRRRGLIQ